ncbi:hypothetical protein DPMN_041721 [Dreissena polymorpha]|uniref:Uncharacterized protein n=2 Tax=Dreissena polymorpha TaxID=45954 RepID=A0A9D4CXR7_DREPO|nr:hypothetical protein DPMN_041721 [Dreissena polymorpha]
MFFATPTAQAGDAFHTTILNNLLTEEIGLLFGNNGQTEWSNDSTTIVVQLVAGDDVWLACNMPSTITG